MVAIQALQWQEKDEEEEETAVVTIADPEIGVASQKNKKPKDVFPVISSSAPRPRTEVSSRKPDNPAVVHRLDSRSVMIIDDS